MIQKKGESAVKESSKAALCGITSALAVVVMLSTYISPFLVYAAPAFAGLLLLPVLNEINSKWALGTYITVCLVSIFIIADKEASVFYALFFGYYPILAFILNKKIRSRLIRFIIKLPIFNLSYVASILICMYVFAIDFDDFTGEDILISILYIPLLNLLFVVYDILVSRLQQLYIIRFQKKIRKLFDMK